MSTPTSIIYVNDLLFFKKKIIFSLVALPALSVVVYTVFEVFFFFCSFFDFFKFNLIFLLYIPPQQLQLTVNKAKQKLTRVNMRNLISVPDKNYFATNFKFSWYIATLHVDTCQFLYGFVYSLKVVSVYRVEKSNQNFFLLSV